MLVYEKSNGTKEVPGGPKIDFPSFFRAAFSGVKEPFSWQIKLANDPWPDVLIAPTGSGKTAGVTLSWMHHRLVRPSETPRRLVWCLPMRTLVDQTAETIVSWVRALDQSAIVPKGHLPTPEDVHVLKGGTSSNDWLYTPECAAIIVGTQDMLLSRALMRGYGSSPTVWPMQFGLLHQDAQWVFDEVQLMGAGRTTSAQLEAFRREALDAGDIKAPSLPTHSMWVSATLEPEWLATVDFQAPSKVLQVNPAEENDAKIRDLVRAPKHLSQTSVIPESSVKKHEKVYIDQLASAVLEAHRPHHMTLVIVNQVGRAQNLYKSVHKALSKKNSGPEVVLIHSRFRSAEREREMCKIPSGHHSSDTLVIATQAIEAGVDISAAVMFTEIAPWASMVQRFGRVNRRAEVNDGAQIYWIDLLGATEMESKEASKIAKPYGVNELKDAREKLFSLRDVAPVHLPRTDTIDLHTRVVRRKDLDDLFDTDADLNGFHVDISGYVRDSDDTDIRVFWRSDPISSEEIPRAEAKELCAVPIGQAKTWINNARKNSRGRPVFFIRDPLSKQKQRNGSPPGWEPLTQDPWPGLTVLADVHAGGYSKELGFTGQKEDSPDEVNPDDPSEAIRSSRDVSDVHNDDTDSELGRYVLLKDHLDHVTEEVSRLSNMLGLDHMTKQLLERAASWHDLGKAHDVFQSTMRRGLEDGFEIQNDLPLAKTVKRNLHHERRYFRHELASALALLAHEKWSRDADLLAYLIVAHHGKIRMNIRTHPREPEPPAKNDIVRFARGVWEGDKLPVMHLRDRESYPGGCITLSIMELGYDELSKESWTERTRDLLQKLGPFKLAFLETLLRVADWRASRKEEEGEYG